MRFISTLCLALYLVTGLNAQSVNQVVFTFHHKGGGQALDLDGVAFPIWNNKLTTLTHAGFYISEIELMRPDSSTVSLTDQYLLVDAGSDNNEYPAGQWDVESIIGLTLHLGVDSAHNHLDPSIYPEGHPLAHQKFQMHWGWLAGYRFMAIEGLVDNNGDNHPESEFQFHNIGDPLYKTVSLSGTVPAENGILNIHLDLEYAHLFQDMAMTGNLIEHGDGPDNAQMMENAATQGFISMSEVTGISTVPDAGQLVRILPNPAASRADIFYELPSGDPAALYISGTNGQVIAAYPDLPSAGSVRLEAAGLANGLYRCIFYQNGRPVAQKSVIMNK